MGVFFHGKKAIDEIRLPASQLDHVTTIGPRWCPKLTRFRLALMATFVAFLVLVVYMSPSQVQQHLVLSSNGSVAPATLPLDDTYHQGSGDRLRAKHTKRYLPQSLIIGVRKAGTRALLTYLDLHPQIRVAKNEVHFFDEDETYAEGLEWYRKKMPFSYADQITMEKTPAYFSTETVPERVYKMNSTIKLLVVLRNPIDRAMSDYLQILDNKMKKNKYYASFDEQCIDDEGNVDTTFRPLKRSIYFRQFKRWLEWFSRDQFLFLNGESMIKDPLTEIRKVEDFLQIRHEITMDNFYFNESRGFFCVKNETKQKCLAPSKGREHPSIDPIVLQKLQNFFRPFNRAFYEMIGQDMGWP